MAQLFANNAYASLASPASAVDTLLTLASGTGARFPSPTGGDYFLATLVGIDGNGAENAWEIVKVTARASDVLTVVRAQESTSAAIWTAGTRIEQRATKGTFDLLVPSTAIGASVQAYDADLSAIAALAGTSGLLKKTAADTWSLDTSAYLTGNQSISISGAATGSGTTAISLTLADSGAVAGTYRSVTVTAKGLVTGGTNPTTLSGYGITDAQALDADLTAIAGLAGTSGFLKKTAADSWALDTSTYLTGNQSIAVSGDASGSGSTAISLTLATVATAGTYRSVTVNAKGLVTAGTNPTTLAGYGITDAASLSANTFTATQTVQGNLAFSGAARRITADFSNATLASRTAFQTSTTNGTTAVQAIANGTAAASYYVAFAGSDPANAAYGWLSATTSGMDIYSDKTGTGTVQPIRFLTGGTVRASVGALGGVDLSTGLREARVAMDANDIDLRTGNYFTKTIAGATTLTVSNVPTTGTAASFILDLTNGGSAAITWWTVKWAGGTAPTLTAAGRDVLGFFTHDGGTTWSGLVLGKDVK